MKGHTGQPEYPTATQPQQGRTVRPFGCASMPSIGLNIPPDRLQVSFDRPCEGALIQQPRELQRAIQPLQPLTQARA